MSDTPDTTPATPAGDTAAQAGTGAQPDTPDGAARVMVAVSDLGRHPANVREDLELTPEFCASIAHAGVRVPLLVTPAEDGGYRVIEGHRRLAAVISREMSVLGL
jgi:ParB/Sulfiredoxin domain